MRALAKMFRLHEDLPRLQAMRETLVAVWCIFDSDGSESIEKDDFQTYLPGFEPVICFLACLPVLKPVLLFLVCLSGTQTSQG